MFISLLQKWLLNMICLYIHCSDNGCDIWIVIEVYCSTHDRNCGWLYYFRSDDCILINTEDISFPNSLWVDDYQVDDKNEEILKTNSDIEKGEIITPKSVERKNNSKKAPQKVKSNICQYFWRGSANSVNSVFSFIPGNQKHNSVGSIFFELHGFLLL